jgi:hypothetical protein
VRPPALYMISETSGNVYWEISAFQHVVITSSMGGEGGKGRRRLPTFRSNRDLTKYYISVFFSLRGIILQIFNIVPFCDEYIQKGDKEKKPD